MTISTNSGFQSTAAGDVYGELMLVELQLRSGTARYTRVWAREGGRWQIVAGQVSVAPTSS